MQTNEQYCAQLHLVRWQQLIMFSYLLFPEEWGKKLTLLIFIKLEMQI